MYRCLLAAYAQAVAEGDINPREWFREDELERCPFCGERAVPRTDAEAAVCLTCEVAWIKDDEPQALQRDVAEPAAFRRPKTG